MRIILFFLFFSLASCNSHIQKRNAELVVTYEGKEVHRASGKYASRDDLTRLVESKERKFIIFSADWCPQCKILHKILKQSGHINKVIILNLDEPWAARLYQMAGLKVVPSMIVSNEAGLPVSIRQGTSQIIMYLLINVE